MEEEIKMTETPFDELLNLKFDDDKVPETIKVTSPKSQTNDIDVVLKYCAIYEFPDELLTCKTLKMEATKVTLSGLKITTHIGMVDKNKKQEIRIENSEIKETENSYDFVFMDSSLSIVNSKLTNVLIAAFNRSRIVIEKCDFYQDAESESCCAMQSSGSFVRIVDSKFHDLLRILYADGSDIRIKNVIFENISKYAILLTNFSESKISKSKFSNCKSICVKYDNSFKNILKKTSFTKSEETPICIMNSNCVMSDIDINEACGNGIFASSGSHFEVRNTKISKTGYPSVILIKSTEGVLENVDIDDAEDSGIVLRCCCSIKASNVNINNSKYVGIKISDSVENNIFENVKIVGSGYDAVNICDGSRVIFNNCKFGNSNEYGINLYTGAEIELNRCLIYGSKISPMYIHRGGSAQIDTLVFSEKDIDIDLIKSLNDTSGEGDLRKICKIETKRPIFAVRIFVDGNPKGFNSIINEDGIPFNNEDPKVFKPAFCLNCSKQIDEFHLFTCGHSCYCKECWDIMKDKVTNCPFCRTVIASASKLFNESPDVSSLCAICYTYVVDSYFIPCGHTICKRCYLRCLYDSDKCPFCREEMVQARTFVTYE